MSSPPHLGRLSIYHKGCWGTDTSATFPNISIEVFVFNPLMARYKADVIIRPFEGTFDLRTRDKIKDRINRHRTIDYCHVKKFDGLKLECENFFELELIANGPPANVLSIIDFFGYYAGKEIGIGIMGGWETHFGLFRSEEDFNKCKEFLGNIYQVDMKRSQYAREGGLQLDPPLRLERMAFGEKEFKEYRRGIDETLKEITLSSETQDNFYELIYRYGCECLDLIKGKMDKVPPEIWAIFVKYLLWLATNQRFDP